MHEGYSLVEGEVDTSSAVYMLGGLYQDDDREIASAGNDEGDTTDGDGNTAGEGDSSDEEIEPYVYTGTAPPVTRSCRCAGGAWEYVVDDDGNRVELIGQDGEAIVDEDGNSVY